MVNAQQPILRWIMINFIVVDDNIKFLDIIVNVITKVMIKNNFLYKISSFCEYDKKFFEIMNSSISNKIYILDIETKSSSGIDIARKIRKNDVDSIIIFATVHNEAGLVLIKDDLMFLSFLCKFDDFENKLYNSISKALLYIDHKSFVRFNDRGTLYTIPIRDILYITKESNDRKCIIKTCSNEYRVNLTLKEFMALCGDDLIRSHRSCLINKERVRKIDKKINTIEFDNGLVIDLLSNNYKKGLGICD